MAKAKQSAVSDEQIIAALMTSSTINQAAEMVSLTPRAIYDRMTSAAFRAAYQAAKSDLIRYATFTLNSKVSDALDTVAQIMLDADEKPAIKLRAAEIILTHAGKFADRLDADETTICSFLRTSKEIDFSSLSLI